MSSPQYTAEQIQDFIKTLTFDENGLLPAIAQQHDTGEVLMLAYQNAAAIERTLHTGQVTYFSRSRQELWQKGETSGHSQELIAIAHDCDADTILLSVNQTGPACHTGTRTCFDTRWLG